MTTEASETVLVVDDDPGVTELQRRRLQRAGFNVCCAASASEAMSRLEEGGVVLVLLDYRLSGELNGLQFYDVMKAAGYDLPVIMVTGFGRENTVIEALRAGVRDFVSKSAEYLDYLPEAVRRVLNQERTERRCAELQARFGAIITSSMDAIVNLDADGRITVFNAAAERLFGCLESEAIGEPCEHFISGLRDLVGLVDGRQSADVPRLLAPFETHGYCRGERILLEVALSSGEAMGDRFYTAMIRDITQRKRVEAELQLAKEAADDANNAKSSFLANMSHELRTPLTAILGFAELLLDDGCDGPDIREGISVIRRNGHYLLDIVNDILDIAKIEAGTLSIDLSPSSPVQLVNDIHALMQIRSQAKGLTLSIDCDGPLPQLIVTDPVRVRQVLINLVGNAIKFTEKGHVRLVVRAQGHVTDELQFEVTDTGIGMTAEQVARLFRPFTQADGSTTRKFGGTGLGLAISKRLATLLGGELTVTSELGCGSAFRLTIPTGVRSEVCIKNPADAATHPLDRDEANPSAVGSLAARILLAEDCPDNQRLVSRVLQKAGADVVVVENGHEAVQTAMAGQDQGRPFDVILMDMQMPLLDGYDATRRLRDYGYRRPIVALTANAMRDDREKCLAAGCDDFVTKPINFRHLIATLHTWLPHGAPREHSLTGPALTAVL
jgi:ammonium transporter, Amt family